MEIHRNFYNGCNSPRSFSFKTKNQRLLSWELADDMTLRIIKRQANI